MNQTMQQTMKRAVKALIVDDEFHIRRGIHTVVPWRDFGVEAVEEAGDGKNAMALFDEHSPDIVLLDINMPGINGMEVARHIRGRNGSTQIIFLTGYDDFHKAREAITLQASDYLLKPVSYDELLQSLEKAAMKVTVNRKESGYLDDLQRRLAIPGSRGQKLLAKELFVLGELRAGAGSGCQGMMEEWLDELSQLPLTEAKIIASQFVVYAARLSDEMGHELPVHAQQSLEALGGCDTVQGLMKQVREFITILSERVRKSMDKPVTHSIEQAREWIREHLSEEISLQTLAAAVHLNPYYLSRLFKQETGETYLEFTTRIRFEKARELLISSALKMHEIAEQVGFTDANYFSIAFKKHQGVSPTDFRKRFQ
ncbi:hypothetical protein BG53_00585 [Paenibacillus darwinianus]|uniref:AraC family transcriptional regulator n=1 Tax=Paenibacillus darwinianus TaxID=1380763 RepID=A0A9W5S246_9BACL|nr:response regulator [Paenibacillus darwinianus]EXX89147.1 hypothetical protein BG53_00585 [Paenibacillus darwinianus]EXX89552.1 hypothetical protein BG52_15300 [Paenibacillus darwinianus]EXX89795.1 hypothetical protein CH50_00895 [Paenibacillus darwinianus]